MYHRFLSQLPLEGHLDCSQYLNCLQTRLKWITVYTYRCVCVEVGARSHTAVSEYGKLEFGGCCLVSSDVVTHYPPQLGQWGACSLISILWTQYCPFFVLLVRWKIVSKSSPNIFKEETVQSNFPFVPSMFISSSLLLKTLTSNSDKLQCLRSLWS